MRRGVCDLLDRARVDPADSLAGLGRSAHPDARTAGAAATTEAIAAGEGAKFLLVFGSPSCDLHELTAGVAAAADPATTPSS